MIYRITLLAGACVLATAAIALPRDRCSEVPAGVILDYIGPVGDYRLVRSGSPLAIAVYRELKSGDDLRILSPTGRLSVGHGDGSIRQLNASDGRVCFSKGSAPSWIGNLWARFGELIAKARNGEGGLITRDGDLHLAPADLARGTALVISGQRPFALLWGGGVAPYTVSVVGSSGAIVSESNLSATMLRLKDSRNIAPGMYRVMVRDAAGGQVAGQFRAVVQPGPTTAVSPDAAILAAGEALSRGDDRRFEAFLLLAPHRASDKSVAAMVDVLAEDRQ